MIEFDPAKDERNVRERGISLARYADMDAATAITWEDNRRVYAETRFLVWGLLGGELHTAVITSRGANTRVISLRRANARERKTYAKKTQPP